MVPLDVSMIGRLIRRKCGCICIVRGIKDDRLVVDGVRGCGIDQRDRYKRSHALNQDPCETGMNTWTLVPENEELACWL